MDVELRHLRAFVAVAELTSFTGAAQALRVSQPALTRTIQQFEQCVGSPVFERTSRMVRLTDYGADLLTRAQRILRLVDDLGEGPGGRHEFRVGFEWALPDPWSLRTFDRFERDAHVQVTLCRRDDALASLRAGEVDVALTRRSPSDFGPDLIGIRLFDEERVAVVSARSSLANRDQIEFGELAAYPLIVNTVSGSTWPGLWPRSSPPTRVRECNNYDEWIALVAADKGIGTTSITSTQTHDHAGVDYLRLLNAPPVTLYVVHRRGDRDRLVDGFIVASLGQRSAAEPETS